MHGVSDATLQIGDVYSGTRHVQESSAEKEMSEMRKQIADLKTKLEKKPQQFPQHQRGGPRGGRGGGFRGGRGGGFRAGRGGGRGGGLAGKLARTCQLWNSADGCNNQNCDFMHSCNVLVDNGQGGQQLCWKKHTAAQH